MLMIVLNPIPYPADAAELLESLVLLSMAVRH